jgi:ABC-2 type transport system permease protein
MDPFRKTTKGMVLIGQMEQFSMNRFQSPLPLGQSLMVVVPYLTILLAITIVCFRHILPGIHAPGDKIGLVSL